MRQIRALGNGGASSGKSASRECLPCCRVLDSASRGGEIASLVFGVSWGGARTHDAIQHRHLSKLILALVEELRLFGGLNDDSTTHRSAMFFHTTRVKNS